MSMTWTSKAMHILHIHISTGQMYNTENHDKSAISCKVSTTLLRSTAWPCWWCMLCYIKTNNTAAIYAAALLAGGGHGVFVQSWAELWLLLLSVCWTCCQLPATGDWQQVHYTEQSRASTIAWTPNTPPTDPTRSSSSALCGSIQGSRVRNVMLR